MQLGFMKYLRRAYHDTFEGHLVRTIFLVGLGAAITFYVVYLTLGGKEAMLELPYIFAGMAGTLGPLLFLFLWNLACAPYRIERDARIEAENKLSELKGHKPVGRLLSNEQQQLLAATIRESGVRPRKMNVVHFPSEECADFAASIGDAIALSGIECVVHDGGMYTKNPKDRGIKLYRSDSRALELLADKICAQLNEFGFPCELRTPTDKDNVFFYIARSD